MEIRQIVPKVSILIQVYKHVFVCLKRISHSFRESMPMLVDNFNVDAWDNCAAPIFDAIAADLP